MRYFIVSNSPCVLILYKKDARGRYWWFDKVTTTEDPWVWIYLMDPKAHHYLTTESIEEVLEWLSIRKGCQPLYQALLRYL